MWYYSTTCVVLLIIVLLKVVLLLVVLVVMNVVQVNDKCITSGNTECSTINNSTTSITECSTTNSTECSSTSSTEYRTTQEKISSIPMEGFSNCFACFSFSNQQNPQPQFPYKNVHPYSGKLLKKPQCVKSGRNCRISNASSLRLPTNPSFIHHGDTCILVVGITSFPILWFMVINNKCSPALFLLTKQIMT